MNAKLQLCIAALISAALAAGAVDARSPSAQTTSRLIVKLRDSGMLQSEAARTSRLARFVADATAAGVAITPHRAMAIGAHVMQVERRLTVEAATALAARLAQHPDVEFAQPDLRRRAVRTTDDTFAAFQTYLGNTTGAINAFEAWDVTTGFPNVVVAVVDTGYLPHADLAGRILPGYDFISDPKISNDGNGRDADASDPGDWVDANDTMDPDFSDCDIENSSWHGTAVTGIIAANSNNAQWLAGINWAAKILPVRVLGKCGGDDSDIIDGVAWAAGLSVPGVPANPNPAQVINISLGGPGDCLAAYHGVFSAALAHGVTRAIVAAAGNESIDIENSVPANCSEVIAVAGTLNSGALTTYSNFGPGIALSAPSGDSEDLAGGGIAVLHNRGKTSPTVDGWAEGAGTSFAAPMVAGVASLMLGLAPNLSAAQLRAMLTSTAAPFPAGSDCNTARCGSGILDARAAVVAANGGATAKSNYQGLWWKSPGGSEDGWGINVAHQGETIFGTWFTYDTTGKGWWLTLIADDNATSGVYTGNLYTTNGPPFNAMPFIKTGGPPPPIGTGTLTFSDVNNGSFHYVVNLPGGPATDTKAITRQPLGGAPFATCSASTNLAAATNYQDIWWAGTSANAGTEQGWGINFAHQGDIVFASWFTYDFDGSPLWLVATAPKIGAGVYKGDFYRPTGPPFNAYDKSQYHANASVGTLTLTFSDGNNATFDYIVKPTPTGPNVTQSKSITRQLFSSSVTSCN